jgi:hypothetical protein
MIMIIVFMINCGNTNNYKMIVVIVIVMETIVIK